jgi:hypothetical protein
MTFSPAAKPARVARQAQPGAAAGLDLRNAGEAGGPSDTDSPTRSLIPPNEGGSVVETTPEQDLLPVAEEQFIDRHSPARHAANTNT